MKSSLEFNEYLMLSFILFADVITRSKGLSDLLKAIQKVRTVIVRIMTSWGEQVITDSNTQIRILANKTSSLSFISYTWLEFNCYSYPCLFLFSFVARANSMCARCFFRYSPKNSKHFHWNSVEASFFCSTFFLLISETFCSFSRASKQKSIFWNVRWLCNVC